MIKTISVSSLILLCTAILEAAVISNLTFLPSTPDLLMLCVLFFSLHNGKIVGETTGFVSGLFLDFLSSAPFGLNCLFRTTLGYLSGLFAKTLNTEGILVPAMLGLIASVYKGLFLLLLSFLYPSKITIYSIFDLSSLFEILMNIVFAPIVFTILKFFRNSIIVSPETRL
ncbi:rod shape-determining protein MreD [Treponema sp.]|uniref:rod shape-determining protein MreD n=1 Tax=Treponema sp. TaxID=166 RepID=UPI0025FDBEBA|nr:rod shape-determining protein MreD [Treponema sp.]MCR5217520.1 rod shape-determining protein MreD [Treponema sp.]